MTNEFIEIKGITKRYNDGHEAVKNINLSIKKGEFVTILGPSGCGKTTLLKMLGGFELPTKGKILVKKVDIKDLPIQRRPTATVFQDYALFPNMTVEKNIAYGLKEMRKQLESVDESLLKNKDKVLEEAKKKEVSKLKEVTKQKNSIRKDIDKLKNKIKADSIMQNIESMNEEEYEQYLENIGNEYEIKTGKSLLKSIPFDIKIYELFNSLCFALKIPYAIKYKTKGEEELIEKYLSYKKKNRQLQIAKAKIDNLEYQYNDLDYWTSYWQNYPMQELDWYEKKNLTRKLTKDEMKEVISKIIKLVGLEGKNKKYPNELSGGMQQRVALARAIIIEPDILLLDEPLSALDAQVRKNMQLELKRLHNELGITFILVTHDQEEALTLSDKVVVMSEGQIQQIGSPVDVYDHPSNTWVAKFIGKANIFQAIYLGKNLIDINGTKIKIDTQNKHFELNQNLFALIRPEDFDVVPLKQGIIKVKIIQAIYKGLMWELLCDWNGIKINIENINKVEENQEVGLTWDQTDIHLMEE